ncbi:glycogen synthase GlgA [Gluconacetobacter sp. 1b LMG 1731]|uniref:Glycogen synthase n=1 Tax=Gluconacetobacter dulcium TaxID=2729096 RepID=A0A7W4INY8_9PROT|nr:glycogen synthase GlgA [Gluconacetobacter dulcium]MBB2166415.1 glycogen synthase GlgA [Gluconacetobacter dulcium]MBB2195577.1 glycogen synthase GlgA [Gluconacetobacter dulcium]
MHRHQQEQEPSGPIRVLSVASEMFPFVKTGGLGDVVGSLPAALHTEGVLVTTLLPGYPAVLDALEGPVRVAEMSPLPGVEIALLEGYAAGHRLLVIDCPSLFRRKGNPYLAPDGTDWPDNGLRFACLSRVAASLAQGHVPGRRPDLVMTHDWQAGLTGAYLHYDGQPAASVVQTIHNLAFQGRFPAADLARFGLPPHAFSIDGVECYGAVGFLKAGLLFAERIITVSPTYAREIQSPEWGMGLDGLLRSRADRLRGILNGIDTNDWNPETDPSVLFPYQVGDLAGRRPNKRAFQAEFGLRQDPNVFLLGLVSRLTGQKGVDILADIIPHILDDQTQLVVVGSGEVGMERALARLSRQYPDRLACHIGYSEQLGHRIQASADALLVPSRFEPCGLTQLCAVRYGCVPIASRVGGLADTIIDANEAAMASDVATGFLFSPVDGETLAGAIRRAATLYRQPARWAGLQRNGARYDVSWGRKAQEYARLFRRVLGRAEVGMTEFDQSSMRRRPPLAGPTGPAHSARNARASYQAARRGRVRANDPFGRPG